MSASNSHLWWSLILYRDSESYSYVGVINQLKQLAEEYYYIVHDNDDVKTHTHFIIKARYPVNLQQLNKNINLHLNVKDDDKEVQGTVEYINAYDKKKAIIYLSHLNAPDKYQYNPDDVITNNQKYYTKCIIDYKQKELDPYQELYDYIKLSDTDLNITDIIDYASQIGQVKVAVRNYYAFEKMCHIYNYYRRKGKIYESEDYRSESGSTVHRTSDHEQ